MQGLSNLYRNLYSNLYNIPTNYVHYGKKENKVIPISNPVSWKNPIISFRLKKEEKEKLEEIVKNTNTSVGKWVSDFVRGKVENEDEKLKLLEENKELNNTIEQLRTKTGTIIRFKIPCSICGRDIVVTPSYSDWDNYIYPELKKAFRGASCDSCRNRL